MHLRGLLYCKHALPPGRSCDKGRGHHHYHGCGIQQDGASSSTAPKQSSRPWNRDVCSALNIMRRVYMEAHGELPACLGRGGQ